MGDVVSLTEVAARVAPLGGEVTAISGPAGDLAEKPPVELKFAEGDIVQVVYRARDGRPEIRSVMYGPSLKVVAQALCRTLQRTGIQIVARPAGTPEPFDLTWVEIAPGQPGAGERLARVRGVSAVYLNLALGRPVARYEHSHTAGKAILLFDPDRGSLRDASPVDPQPDLGDDE